jgi:hypothetical protein
VRDPASTLLAADPTFSPCGHREYAGSVSTYAVLLVSANGLVSGVGLHAFDDPPIEGREVELEGETWVVEEVDDRSVQPTITLKRVERS